MADPLAAAPKVELHLHLEGAIPLDLLWDLVNKHGGDPAVPSRRALIDHLRYTSFPDFIDTWVWMTGFIRSYDDFTRLAEDVAAGLARLRRGVILPHRLCPTRSDTAGNRHGDPAWSRPSPRDSGGAQL